MKALFDIQKLPIQLTAAFIIIVLLTAATVGLPAFWLLKDQLDQQAWSQVEQGQRAATALYGAKHREILHLATLTAQRPTLQELLISRDIPALTNYLHILKSGAGLSLIVICDPEDQIVATTEQDYPVTVCKNWKTGNYHFDPLVPQLCLTAHQAVEDETGLILGDVFVCLRLDDDFTRQIKEETGLEHTIWINDQPVATSFENGVAALLDTTHPISFQEANNSHSIFEIEAVPYYAVLLPLDGDGLNASVALNVTEIQNTRNQLTLALIGGILGIALVGSTLGVVFSGRISRPLVRLAEAAETISHGDLHEPVDTSTGVREVAQLARALESARSDLLKTMTTLQSERDWSEHLLASIVEGIVTLDKAGKITFFSHGAERISGWSAQEVLDKPCNMVFKLVDSQQDFTNTIPEPGHRGKADVQLADGQVASLAITRAELTPADAADSEIVLVFRDISEEEAVHRILAHFLANIAHEFRTPLAASAASIELLLDQASDLNPDELQELMISLHLGTLGLQTLVDNLLESASLEAGRFRISARATDLGTIVAEAAETMQPLLAKYEQTLTIDLPIQLPLVRADPRRIIQVLVNLLGNASKYGPPDAEIQLKVTLADDEVRLSIADRGPGIPTSARGDIFHRFLYPDDASNTSQAGAGLGLSVVKAIVNAHGGRVGVDDHPGGGSIFWFTLPIVKETE